MTGFRSVIYCDEILNLVWQRGWCVWKWTDQTRIRTSADDRFCYFYIFFVENKRRRISWFREEKKYEDKKLVVSLTRSFIPRFLRNWAQMYLLGLRILLSRVGSVWITRDAAYGLLIPIQHSLETCGARNRLAIARRWGLLEKVICWL